MEKDNIYTIEYNIKNIFKLVLPSIISFVVIALYQTVDAMFIGNFVGDFAVGAVNLFMPILYFVFCIGVLLSTGCNAYLPNLLGQKKEEEVSDAFSSAIIFLYITSAIFTLILLFFRDNIISILGASLENRLYLYQYYTILSAGTVAVVSQVMVNTLLIADGKGKMTVLLSVLGGVTNCGLDYLFMKVFRMGITGAAIATI